jgi:ribosomal-protein-alanine N-acetyltransferase
VAAVPEGAPRVFGSARLAYRRPVANDARMVFERYASDATATRYMAFPRHRSLEDTRAFIAWSDAQWNADGVGTYLLFDPATGTLLGSTGLHRTESPERAALGYILAPDSWGRGLATEALGAMVGLAGRLGHVAVEAPCHPDNLASRRVLEKGGFVESGRRDHLFPNLGPQPVASIVYARQLPVRAAVGG